MKTKVLIVDRVYKRSENIFSQADDMAFIVVGKQEAQVAAMIEQTGAKAVVLATDKYDEPMYDALGEGGLIARYGVGHDGVDKALASANRQLITITPGVLDNAVAEHAMFLLGSLARNIAKSSCQMKQGNWNKSTGVELSGKTLAIIGCGAIGRRVAQIASLGFSMKVIGFDAAPLDAQTLKSRCGIEQLASTIDQAVSDADAVSIHLPPIESTRDFVNAQLLAKMKPSAMLINTSRGSIVDESALFDALSDNQIAGAALDVFKAEPYEPQDETKDLRKLENIILTPHLGSSTDDASDKMALCVLKNIRLWNERKYNEMDIVNKDILTELK
jgi:lactate dehydrogenase-like 2-hydroxyacid dehydrogenase